MNTDNLIVEANLYPTDSTGIINYINTLEDFVTKLKLCDLECNLNLKKFIEESFTYLSGKLSYLKNHIDGDVDFIAWISRSFLELYFILRYGYMSKDNILELFNYPIKELTDIDEAIYEKGKPEILRKEDEIFRTNLKIVVDKMKKDGISFDKSLSISKQIAERSGLLNYYEAYYKLHSKYVHPTPYLLYGKKSFVYSEEARVMFCSLALHFATIIILDTIKHFEINSIEI